MTIDNNNINYNISRNYMRDDYVFLLDELTSNNCAFLIGDLTAFVLDDLNRGKQLNIIINSPGGEVNVMYNIIGLMHLAKLNDISIDTIILGFAGSAASIIASQGDRRYMTDFAQHFIHFGCIPAWIQKYSEIDKVNDYAKDQAGKMHKLYIEASDNKLNEKILNKIQEDERGYLNADTCIKYGLCDVIIENTLADKLLNDRYSEEYSAGYDKFLKDKQSNKSSKIKKVINTITKKE